MSLPLIVLEHDANKNLTNTEFGLDIWSNVDMETALFSNAAKKRVADKGIETKKLVAEQVILAQQAIQRGLKGAKKPNIWSELPPGELKKRIKAAYKMQIEELGWAQIISENHDEKQRIIYAETGLMAVAIITIGYNKTTIKLMDSKTHQSVEDHFNYKKRAIPTFHLLCEKIDNKVYGLVDTFFHEYLES